MAITKAVKSGMQDMTKRGVVAMNHKPLYRSVALVSLLALLMSVCAVITLRGCMSEHTRSIGYEHITFRLSPRGDQIVFNAIGNGGCDLFLLDMNSCKVTQVTDTPDYETTPAFSPDSQSLVYCAGRSGERADHLFLRDLDTNQVKQLTAGEANDCSPTFSPDGSRIVFTRNTHYNWGGLAASWSGGGSVWSIQRDGSGLKRLLPAGVFAVSPRLSSDGKTLLWWGTEGIFIAPTDGSAAPQRLIGEKAREAVFSPDGKKIAFTQGPYGLEMQIYLMPVSGGVPTRVTTIPQGYLHPEFSSDGKSIYYCVETWSQGGSGVPQCSLWRMGIDGSDPQELAGSELFDAPLQAIFRKQPAKK